MVLLPSIYPNVAKAYAANNDMEKAYRYLDSANIAKDSVAKRRNNLFTSDVEHKIEIEKHFAYIKGKEADMEQQTLFKNALFAVLALLLLLLFFVFRNLSNQKK